MIVETIRKNLTKIDASPNGIFFLSYTTPIAYIIGREEFVNSSTYSPTTTRHSNELLGEHVVRGAAPMDAETMGQLCKDAGISCDW